MSHTSKAQRNLTGTGYPEDDEGFSLTELEEREKILRRILTDAQIEIEGVINPMIVSRVMDLKDFARRKIADILSNLESNKGLSPDEIARLQSIPQVDQFDALMVLFKERLKRETQ